MQYESVTTFRLFFFPSLVVAFGIIKSQQYSTRASQAGKFARNKKKTQKRFRRCQKYYNVFTFIVCFYNFRPSVLQKKNETSRNKQSPTCQMEIVTFCEFSSWSVQWSGNGILSATTLLSKLRLLAIGIINVRDSQLQSPIMVEFLAICRAAFSDCVTFRAMPTTSEESQNFRQKLFFFLTLGMCNGKHITPETSPQRVSASTEKCENIRFEKNAWAALKPLHTLVCDCRGV